MTDPYGAREIAMCSHYFNIATLLPLDYSRDWANGHNLV